MPVAVPSVTELELEDELELEELDIFGNNLRDSTEHKSLGARAALQLDYVAPAWHNVSATQRQRGGSGGAAFKMFLVKQTITKYRTFPRHSKSAGIRGIFELFREIYLSDHIVQTPATQRETMVGVS